MKRILLTFSVSCACLFGFAQTEAPTQKYSVATNDFWSNWFVTAGLDGTAFIGGQEKGMGLSQNLFRSYRNALGFGVGVGKWFTPGIGARLKFQGVNGKGVFSDNSCINKKNMKNYWTMNGQMLFNLSNLICGYNENRLWNVIVYPGAGLMRNMTKNVYALNVQAGLMNTFRITKNLDAFVDVNLIIAEPKADGIEMRSSSQKYSFQNYDKIYSAEIGLKYNFGKATWKKTPDVDAINALNEEQVATLNASLKSAQEENERLKLALSKQNSDIQKLQDELNANRNQTKTVATSNTEKETCVFFAQGKSIITNAQRPNVERAATFLKANPNANVVIKGYASPEGPAGLNQKLSLARANAVKKMLVNKYGIAESRITTQGCGVGEVFSTKSWNRVAISTVK